MTKAYDRIEWGYLKGVLTKLGFNASFVDTVMRCVTSVRYTVKINGNLSDPFIPTRGIRQGDPISPYLFLLCAEGLSCLLQQKEAAGEIKGIRNGREGPPISHLLFADDSVFFMKSDSKSTDNLKAALQTYCNGSGQKINLKKSSLFFGPHCDNQVKEQIKNKLGVQDESLQATYLGMPSWVGRSPTSSFNFLTGRLWKILNGWNDRPLSRAGKEVLLKSVAQAIPTYVMSCFRIPTSICENMRRPISNFWWGAEDGKKKIHWRSWDWLSTPKYLGGMGFRDLSLFNQAMLAKQCWRLLVGPKSLCFRVLKGRYFPNEDFWSSGCPRSASYTWRSLMFGKKLLHKGLLWRVGDGKKISLTRDNWIPDSVPGTICRNVTGEEDKTVNHLFSSDGKAWNEVAVREMFPEDLAAKILKIPISSEGCSDFASWPHTKGGIYTVRSGYNLARSLSFWQYSSLAQRGSSSDFMENENIWRKLWKIQCPNRMKIILWRMAHNCLPTGDQLQRRAIPTRYECIFCNRDETVEHCFFKCHYVKEIWSELKKSFHISLNLKAFIHIQQWLLDWIRDASEVQSLTFAVATWHIWENRNNVRNGESLYHPHRVAGKIKAYIDFILLNNFRSTQSTRRENQTSVLKWSPPSEGSMMVNVDAALFSQSQRMGVGIVIRDHLGRLQAARRRYVDQVVTPELAEAIAMRCALEFAEDGGFQRIVVASDCDALVNKVNSTAIDRSQIGAVVYDIKSWASKFVSCSFIHVNRSCNEAAHVLARSAEHDVESTWFSDVPETIRTIVCTEQLMF
jgi:ribonuclease HI